MPYTMSPTIALGQALVSLHLFLVPVAAICNFPSYLWEPIDEHTPRLWIAETIYLGNSSRWLSQNEIRFHGSKYTISRRIGKDCPYSSLICIHKRVISTGRCVYQEDQTLFKLLSFQEPEKRYLCMRIVRRTANILQIHQAYVDEGDACSINNLTRDPWLWFAEGADFNAAGCMASGGFEFRTHIPTMHQTLCKKFWLPSRMEVSCLYPSVIVFSFPKKRCSPFSEASGELQLYCGGGWTEGSHTFLVVGAKTGIPRYVLRFPKQALGSPYTTERYTPNNFMVDLYFSPVAPLGDNDDVIGVQQVLLETRHADSELCRDNSERCAAIASERPCTFSDRQQYTQHCRKSCRLCRMLPAKVPECHFPEEMQGDWWKLGDLDRIEPVKVANGEIIFSSSRRIICKARHYLNGYLKVLIVAKNGCGPRFSCLRLKTTPQGFLWIQYGRMSNVDQSFDLCEFPPQREDDSVPPGAELLLPSSGTRFKDCGIHGEKAAEIFTDGRFECRGSLSDWDDQICSVTPVLRLSSNNCSNNVRNKQAYGVGHMCENLLVSGDVSYLFTVATLPGGYSTSYCWVFRYESQILRSVRLYKGGYECLWDHLTDSTHKEWQLRANVSPGYKAAQCQVRRDLTMTTPASTSSSSIHLPTRELEVVYYQNVARNYQESSAHALHVAHQSYWTVIIIFTLLNMSGSETLLHG